MSYAISYRHVARRELRSLEQWYLDAMHQQAEEEMKVEFQRRENWETNKKEARKIPAYARHFLVANPPARIALQYKRQAGALLDAVFPRDAIREAAFYRAPWGRLRKCYRGDNSTHAGIRTETNGKSGWDCVSWHYADYTAIVSRDGKQIYVVYPDRSSEIVRLSPNRSIARVDGLIVRNKINIATPPAIRAHHLRRYYSAPLRGLAPVRWEWSREEKAGYYLETTTGEKYHTEPRPTGPAAKYYRAAIEAFRKRREEHEKTARREAAREFLRVRGRDILITADDSVSSGNCPAGTQSFAQRLRDEYGLQYVIPAPLLLKIRRDSFTERAALAAAERCLFSD